jgi:hypothetical protein
VTSYEDRADQRANFETHYRAVDLSRSDIEEDGPCSVFFIQSQAAGTWAARLPVPELQICLSKFYHLDLHEQKAVLLAAQIRLA